MLRSFSHLFAGPAEKEGKQTEWPADEASTAPGSSGGASDGAEDSLPSDVASDGSVEESPAIHGFDGEPACGAAQLGIEHKCAEDKGEKNTQPPECAQAVADEACAADEPAREERACRGPPSRLPQARRNRAAQQKYERRADGTYSKIRAVCDWDYSQDGELLSFPSVEALMDHERSCQERRQCGEHPAKYETLSAESQALVCAMNACADEQHEATRAEIHASTDELLRELKTLSIGSAKSSTEGADRLTVFELVHGSLKCDGIRALLATKNIFCQSRHKAILAKAAAVSLEVAEVSAFLADEGGARRSAVATMKKRPNDGTTQTTLPVVKRVRV